MNYYALFDLKEKLIREAINHSETLPESERQTYVNAYIEATMSFFTHSFIASLDEEADLLAQKKSA